MKKKYTFLVFLIAGILLQNTIKAQCGTPVNLGSASNMITLIRNGTSSIAADKNLNTITFIHRNNAGVFGGSSGHVRYDISTNGGTTWALDQGVVNTPYLYPHRYPNVAIYNPTANTNTANAYMSFMNPVIDSAFGTWIGVQTGVSHFNSTGTTNSYNQNGIGQNQCPNSLVTGSTGVMWAVDAYAPSNIVAGIKVYKGVWNGTNDFIWNINYSVTPTFISVPTIVEIDFNIAFDPTGTIGWFCFPAHINTPTAGLGWYPVFYKTTDGGATWNGPIEVDLSKFSCITSNVSSGMNVSINPGNDLVVDVNGNPHMITTVGSSSGYVFNYNAWHHMYDITMKDGMWVAVDLGNVNGSPYAFGVTTFATQWQAPQASRSKDGTKLFFTWTDNSSYSLGSPNSTPDLFGKAYNVTTDTWTQTKNFTSCNINTAGKILFPHIAAEVLEPTSSSYLIPTVYGEPSLPNNLDVAANFKYLDNVTFSSSDFSITIPPANVSIQQGPSIVLCPNGTITLNVSNAGQTLWSTGATTNSIAISSGTVNSYSVTAQVGCNTGTASVTVDDLNVSILTPNNSVCKGDSTILYAYGNALSYTWTAGHIIDDSTTVVSPITSTIYTLNASGTSCVFSNTISITVHPSATLNIAGGNTVCIGSALTLTASGGYSYSWSDSSVGDVAAFSPTVSPSTYTLYNSDEYGCVTTKTFTISTVNLPNVSIVSNRPGTICKGESVVLVASGANTYVWNTNANTFTASISPTITTTYTVTGTSNSTGCSNFATFTQTVNACTGIDEMKDGNIELSVYPNPNSGELIVYVSNFNDKMSVEIYNNMGQLILQEKLISENSKLNLSSQPNGIYFVNVLMDGKKSSSAKIIKQ